MKKHVVNIAGYTLLAVILVSAFGLTGCGGNNQEISVEPFEEVIHSEMPTEKVIPTEAPTEELVPTKAPTEEMATIEEAIPTDDMAELPPILGTYSVAGLDPDHNNYEDTLEITASNGILQWNWLNREPIGIGLVQEDVVSVAWSEEKECNVISFFIDEDGVLDGIYTEKDETRIGSDKSKPMGEDVDLSTGKG